jgi:heavy metal translocating P-type ATPase
MAQGVSCSLCELACGRQKIVRAFAGRELAFCCMGCANVYAILEESGVIAGGQSLKDTEIFRRSLELGLISNPGGEREPTASIDPTAPTQEMLLQVGGMWCSACGWLIEHALRKLPGVVAADVFFASDLAKVKYCPQYLPPQAISARIAQLGYKPSEYSGENAAAKAETRDLLLRLGVAAFLWANIMTLSVTLYVGYFEQIAQSVSRFLPWILFALATPLVFYCAYPILRSAAIGLRNLQIRMEVLLSLGILTAYSLSAAQVLRGQTHVYFDTAAAIVTLVLAGKLIERGAKERAARAISMMYRLMPKKVRVAIEGGERFVSIDALEPGTVFVVKVGERVPADGIILDGETESDESLLTGESAPVSKSPGDTVVSGSLNTSGAITVRALRRGDDSALVQIIRLVERALSTRAPIEQTVDLVSRVFVPLVVVIALADFAALTAMHTAAGVALMRATSILVIACPCALGLATPLALTAALGLASQQGILISNSRVLEAMGKLDLVILDKTGTVTYGDFRLLDFALIPHRDGVPRDFVADYLPVLAGIELSSEHLLGRAVVQYAREHNVRPVPVESVSVRKGEGITAVCGGHCFFIGNRKLANALSARIEERTCTVAEEWQHAGKTVAYFGRNNELHGLIGFGDRIKPGAAELIECLRRRGIATRLVSGDAAPTTAAVAGRIGVDDFVAEMSPEGKASLVRELQESGKRVAVIGDGVNDAPALAGADLGIALGTGADVAMSAAPVVLVGGSLEKVEEIFQLGARATRVIRQNLFWAFVYNTAGIALAISGLLNPIMAAGAMLLSSTSVVANSMRLSRSRPSNPIRPRPVLPRQEDRLRLENHRG